MQRREFIAGLGAAAWPLEARTQLRSVPTVGFLFAGSPGASRTPAFRKGLNETGYLAGRNVAIEYRYAEDRYDRLPALAAELVRWQVDAIYAGGGVVAI